MKAGVLVEVICGVSVRTVPSTSMNSEIVLPDRIHGKIV